MSAYVSNSPFSLRGKSILVTGASSGIGRSVAVECSKAGANLYITGRNTERLNKTMSALEGSCNKLFVADLTAEDELRILVQQIDKIDGICLCAGINQTVPLGFLSRKNVDSIFETNFFSQIELLRLILRKKLLNENASVVAISSIGGNYVFTPGAAAYGASKASLLSWMKTAAKELAPKFRINCICPGQIDTPMNKNGQITEEQYTQYMNSIPMKCFGKPEDVAYGTLYLLSNASKWVTGSVLTIDGGTTL